MRTADERHVFISHAWIDGTEHAQRLYDALTARGISAWLDKTNLNPFNDFSGEIDRQIKRASHVVVCVTPDIDREDSYVRLEIGYAKGHRKPIIAALFEDVVPPSPIVNHTRAYFHKGWEAAFAQMLDYLSRPPDYSAPLADPFQAYLDTLRQEIEDYLEIAIIREIPLHSRETPGMAQTTATKRMLGSLFATTVSVKPEAQKEPQAFESLGVAYAHFGGRLLLLGEPGAGKTISLMTLVRAMAAKRLADPTAPLPIFARIADWDGKTALVDWLAGQVPIRREDVAGLIDHGQALLVLDGLDELGSEREDPETKEKYDPREKFLNLLPSNSQIIISCRIKDYAELEQKAAVKGAVTLQPLSDDQMEDYLREQPDLWAALQADNALRDIARTPLLLSLFAYAFNGLDQQAKKLHTLARGDVRDKIFETYVRRRYEHEAAKRPLAYSLEEMTAALRRGAFRGLDETKLFSIQTMKLSYESENPDELDPTYFVNTDVSDTVQRTGNEAMDAGKAMVEIHRRTEAIPALLEQACLLHLLIPSGKRYYRFIHLLLRDYFAYHAALEELKASHQERRKKAVHALKKLDDARAIEPLLTALDDPELLVRYNAAEAMRQLGGERAVEALLSALHDNPDPYVRRSAVRGLGQLGGERAIEGLLAALRDDPDADVRWMAAAEVGNLDAAQALDGLVMALGDRVTLVRRRVAETLKTIGTPEAFAALEAWRKERPNDYF